jgi:putative transposase
VEVDDQLAEAIALHRWAVIAEVVNPKLTPAERGVVARAVAERRHAHPDGSQRVYGRSTIDRWVRDWRAGGLEGLRPKVRSDSGLVRYRPELLEEAAALRLELPTRSAAAISDMLCQRHGVRVPERTVANYLRRRGLHREALTAEPKVFGRYEASAPNERWITDVLIGPWVPYPKVGSSIRARLFLIVDDHSRLLVHGRFCRLENARAGQEVLRSAILRRGLPDVLYADNGAPFSNRALDRTCAILGIRLVHSKPYSPEGRGKQERLNRYIRERFITEAEHSGIEDLAELNDRFEAWAEQVANRRVHAETGQSPAERWAPGEPRAVDVGRLAEAFRWSTTRRVTRTATVSLEGNTYSVNPALVGRRVELRYQPEDLSTIEVYLDGRPAGVAIPFVIGRHVAKAVSQAARPDPAADTGIDYLGLVAAAHEAEVVGSISFAQISRTADKPDDVGNDPHEEDRWQS